MTEDELEKKLHEIFARYEELLFDVTYQKDGESVSAYRNRVLKTISAAPKEIRSDMKDFTNSAIPSIKGTSSAKEKLEKFGAIHDAADVKLTTYVQMMSSLSSAADSFREKIDEEIRSFERSGKAASIPIVKGIVKDLLISGKAEFITFKNGTKMPVEKYAAMLARTSRIETSNVSMLCLTLDEGNDLVTCNIIPSTCDICSVYQGRIFSISGKSKNYPALYETAFKRGYSIIHPNCRHRFFPYNPQFLSDSEREKLERDTHRSWEPDTGKRHFQQSEAARDEYARGQQFLRQCNRELNEYSAMKAAYEARGEKPPYQSLGSFRRSYRSAKDTEGYEKSHYWRQNMQE